MAGDIAAADEAQRPAGSTSEDCSPSTSAACEADQIREEIRRLQAKLVKCLRHEGVIDPYGRTYGRTPIDSVLTLTDAEVKEVVGKTLRFGGWVKRGREAGGGSFAFLDLNDGSCGTNLQVVVPKEVAVGVGALKDITFAGTSLLVEGVLSETPTGTKQKVELKATKICHFGRCDNSQYPLAGKKISMEFLREKAHLRARTDKIGAVARIRDALAFATHEFFHTNGFRYVHTPIVTASDCEGAGEMFQVTTLLGRIPEEQAKPALTADEYDQLVKDVSAQGGMVKEAKQKQKEDKDNAELKKQVDVELGKLKQLKEKLAHADDRRRFVGGIARMQDGTVDYRADFFGRPSFLTVSGQLQAENYACALAKVYTFGPTFRAENSNTARHLAEFWMIEPEMAFADLEDDMRCAEDYVQYCCSYLLRHCREDMELIVDRVDKGAIERLEHVATTPFKRLPYTEAIEVLEDAVKKGKQFEFKVEWGIDLSSEHERFLTEEVFKQPVIVYNYPKDIKAFYMKLNPDGKTVAAMDVLVPKVGELVGGSQREDNLQLLEQRITELGMELDAYETYLDLRRFGNVPHAGFGLGFERLILFATGFDNIRDVIPFPRWPGNAAF